MLLNAPSCPECGSRHTRWLPATSEGAFVDYFRCESCAAVWVVNVSGRGECHQITPSVRNLSGIMFLFVDLDAGLLFAAMAKNTDDHERRRRLQRKAQTVFDTVTRFLPRCGATADEHQRITLGLNLLGEAIETINSK